MTFLPAVSYGWTALIRTQVKRRGRNRESPVADLVMEGTVNAPKWYSSAAMLEPELAVAYEDLQDRLRDRVIKLRQSAMNARRGRQGSVREDLARIEVVELRHERSRFLDPNKHRMRHGGAHRQHHGDRLRRERRRNKENPSHTQDVYMAKNTGRVRAAIALDKMVSANCVCG